MKKNKVKVLLIDIETSPIISYTWGIFDQNVALNQIKQDWNILSFAAKWLGDPPSKIIYDDLSKVKDKTNDKHLLVKIWKLLDECDIVLGQNSKRFDVKKINARFITNKMHPPSSYRQLDTLEIAKKKFAFTSNKLEWMTKILDTDHKKLIDKKFPGFTLWDECMKGNKKAWSEMKRYNVRDVTSLEDTFNRLQAWDSSINFNLYTDGITTTCNCGNEGFEKKGFSYTATGKFQRYRCEKCGAQWSDKVNLLTKEKRASIKKRV